MNTSGSEPQRRKGPVGIVQIEKCSTDIRITGLIVIRLITRGIPLNTGKTTALVNDTPPVGLQQHRVDPENWLATGHRLFRRQLAYLLGASGYMTDHIMTLACASADKFVLLAEGGLHHCGKFCSTPLSGNISHRHRPTLARSLTGPPEPGALSHHAILLEDPIEDRTMLDVLGFFPTELTDWEKRPSKKDID